MLVTQTSLPSSIEPHRPRATTDGSALKPVASTSLKASPGAFFHSSATRLTSATQSATSAWAGITKRAGTKWFPPVGSLCVRTFTGIRARKPGDTTPCCSW